MSSVCSLVASLAGFRSLFAYLCFICFFVAALSVDSNLLGEPPSRYLQVKVKCSICSQVTFIAPFS